MLAIYLQNLELIYLVPAAVVYVYVHNVLQAPKTLWNAVLKITASDIANITQNTSILFLIMILLTFDLFIGYVTVPLENVLRLFSLI